MIGIKNHVKCLLNTLSRSGIRQRVSLTCALLCLLSSCIDKHSVGLRIYVTNEASGDLSVIDGRTHRVIHTAPLGKRPRGIQVLDDKIYVALSGSPFAPPGIDESTLPPPDRTADGIGVYDIQRNRLVKVMPAGSDPEQFAVHRAATRLYVANEDAGTVSVLDLNTGLITATIPVGEEPEGVSLSPKGDFIYATSENNGEVFLISTATNSVSKTLKVGRRPRSVVFLLDGSKAYVSEENGGSVSVINAVKQEVVSKIQLGDERTVKPMGLVLSPGGKRLYVTTGRYGKLFVIDPENDRILTSFPVGQRPWGIGISPDGRYVYTANGPSNDVSVVDVQENRVVTKVHVGDRPWGIAVVP